jgi:hypothetical protein
MTEVRWENRLTLKRSRNNEEAINLHFMQMDLDLVMLS